MKERKCYKCGNTKPLTKEFFAKAGKNGFDKMCKVCKEKWNREYYKTHPAPIVLRKVIGKFMIRNSVRTGLWTVFLKDPWTRFESFESLEDAEEWTKDK